MKDNTKPFISYLVRFPPELHAALKAWAQEERRTLHDQILRTLEHGYAAAHADNTPPPQPPAD